MRSLLDWKPILLGWIHRLLAGIYFKRLGKRARIAGSQHFYRPMMKIEIGDDAMLGRNIFWQVARKASARIGDRVSLNAGSFVVISEGLEIGDNVAIGELVSIRDSEHNFHPDHGVRDQGFTTAPIVIEPNCWIGRGVYLGPGTHIRSGSIVAANSVVRGEFPPNSLIAGAPAVVKKTIVAEETAP